jgi:hypothetical protein
VPPGASAPAVPKAPGVPVPAVPISDPTNPGGGAPKPALPKATVKLAPSPVPTGAKKTGTPPVPAASTAASVGTPLVSSDVGDAADGDSATSAVHATAALRNVAAEASDDNDSESEVSGFDRLLAGIAFVVALGAFACTYMAFTAMQSNP